MIAATWTGVPGVNPDLLPVVIANFRLAQLPGTDIRADILGSSCRRTSSEQTVYCSNPGGHAGL